jgi:predicted RNA-binding Zn ribbon-like protein
VNFNSHIDTVVNVAVDLVNALTAGEAHGRGYLPPDGERLATAVTAILQAGSPRTRAVTQPEAAALAKAAAALRTVFEDMARGEVDGAACRINTLLAQTDARPHLDRHDGEPWHLHFHGDGSQAGGWAAGCATGLAVVLGTDDRGRLGVCSAPHCDRVYVDTSRNGTRRFCSTACQNRVKTAAFRTRRAGTPTAQPT